MTALFATALAHAAPTVEEIKATYREILPQVDSDRIRRTYEDVAAFGSRLAGSAGEGKAFAYADRQLTALGAKLVEREPFEVTVPDPDATGTLNIGGRELSVFPMWPNLVRTSTVDATGSLLYGKSGSLEDLRGLEVKGRIVILDFNAGARWRNAAKLGAKAILFLEPDNPNRSEAEKTFAGVPLSVPRFYLPLKSAAPVLAAARNQSEARIQCRQSWVRRQSQNAIYELPGSDPALANQPIALMAYVDAMSVVPSQAPGAEAIGNLATMLEVARIYAKRDRKRPLRFIVSGAHGLSLQGSREFVEKRLATGKGTPFLTVSLDITSGAYTVGSSARGWYYEYRDEPIEQVRNVSRMLRAHGERLAQVMGIAPARLVLIDATNNGDNRTWKNNVSGKFALDCEPMLLAGINALTFATTEDSRPRVDTPFDTLDRIDFGNVRRQVQTVAAMMHHLLNDPADKAEPSDHKVPLDQNYPERMRLIGGFAALTGQVVSFDPTRSFVPDTPVTGSLATMMGRQTTMMGVRGDIVSATDPETAAYRIIGAAPVNAFWSPTGDLPRTRLAAFRLNDDTGAIEYAASLGIYGDFRFPIDFRLKVGERTSPIVVFPCVTVDIYDLVDPQDLRAMRIINQIDADTGSIPQDFGVFYPPFDQRLNPETEDSQVFFFTKGQKYLLLGGDFETRLILTNSSVGNEQGIGYVAPGFDMERLRAGPNAKFNDRSFLGSDGLFPNTALNTAKDIIAINQTRLDRFDKYRIISPGIKELHQDSLAEIEGAEQALEAKDWGEAQRRSRAAWGFALRAHPVIMATANDVVNGVVFYLFLLIPFSFFIERLAFGHQLLTKQLATSIGIFIASFILLRLIHPAFEIVTNPTMIFVAFVMGVLSLLVTSFILGKFEQSLKAIRAQQSGVHEVDIKRSSVAMAAFNLGVSNMRRRKARTILTTLTLVVMTFIVLSFTSIVSDLSLNEAPSDNEAAYSGMLIRTPGLDPLQLATFRTVANEFEGKGTVVRRAYYYGSDINDAGVLTLRRADRVAELRAMLGLEPDEEKVLQPQRALLPGGRWFRPGDRNVMILPTPLAIQLKIEPGDVGKATVDYAGTPFTVIGLIDPAVARSVLDLDGDGVFPPDFTLSRQYQQATASSTQAFRKYLRIDPANVFLVPAETAFGLGADMRSIAVRFEDPAATRTALTELMPRLRLNMYASVPEADGSLAVKQFSVFQASKSTGLALIIVQLIIASVFVLNTMIASVFERTREIGIFSSIGLAPNHIAMLFFAESLVYGILGAVIGYFTAQGTAKVIVATGALPGLTLNFSSTSAVLSAVIVMAVVVGSTIYPARKAAQIAAPAMNDEVFETEPEGDVWELPLPFSISNIEAAPLTAFLGEWLKAYEGYTIGDFVSKDTRFGLLPPDGPRPGYVVESTTWLAPYDLGVSQRLRLTATPGQVPGVYLLDLTLERLAGDPENWPIVNRRFLANVRKQFLTWRTLEREQRQRYMDEVQEFEIIEDRPTRELVS